MTLHILTHDPYATYQALLTENARLRAELDDTRALLTSPGWGIPIAGEMLHRIRVIARGAGLACQYVDTELGDLDYLKQLNIGAGSQGRTNDWIRPALTLREGDGLIRGQVDGADMFMFVFPAGQGATAMAAIKARLAEADMTFAERCRYAQAVCRRRWGPFVGDVRYWLHRAGWHISTPLYPTITTRSYHNVHVSELENLFNYGDAAVFDLKLARGVGR